SMIQQGATIAPLPLFAELKRSRDEARAAGAELFFPGVPCKGTSNPHIAPHRVRGGKCCACLDEAREKKAKAAEKERERRRVRMARQKAIQDARMAEQAKRRAEKLAASRAETRAKAAATRAASKAAKEAAEQAEAERLAVAAVPELLPAADDGTAPWDDSSAPWDDPA
ncbi:MAG: hypothetical protein KGL43_18900, partial [Burkholderiales bacterium]|nr:hypothetical protein [Burkholderiales bacterium]